MGNFDQLKIRFMHPRLEGFIPIPIAVGFLDHNAALGKQALRIGRISTCHSGHHARPAQYFRNHKKRHAGGIGSVGHESQSGFRKGQYTCRPERELKRFSRQPGALHIFCNSDFFSRHQSRLPLLEPTIVGPNNFRKGGKTMSGAFTKSMARNIFYGGTTFFFLLFLALSSIPIRNFQNVTCGKTLRHKSSRARSCGRSITVSVATP